MANIGYARVSTKEQNLNSQLDELQKKGCEKIFTDKVSGGQEKLERPGLQDCLDYIRKGDVLIITKFDRLGRSLKDLIRIVDELHTRDIEVVSIQDNIETNTMHGKLFFHIFGAFAEFEKNIIGERVRAGLASAKARGRKGGRRRKMTQEKIEAAYTLLKSGISPTDAAKQLGVSRSTFYSYVQVQNIADNTNTAGTKTPQEP